MTGSERREGRARDAHKTRAAILNAAETIFAQHGFDGARIEAIANASGYNNSLLFRYFGDKLGLYAEVLKRADKEMSELLDACSPPCWKMKPSPLTRTSSEPFSVPLLARCLIIWSTILISCAWSTGNRPRACIPLRKLPHTLSQPISRGLRHSSPKHPNRPRASRSRCCRLGRAGRTALLV